MKALTILAALVLLVLIGCESAPKNVVRIPKVEISANEDWVIFVYFKGQQYTF